MTGMMRSVCTLARFSGSGRQHHGQRPPCRVNIFAERVGDSRPSMQQLYGSPLTFSAAMIASTNQRGGRRRRAPGRLGPVVIGASFGHATGTPTYALRACLLALPASSTPAFLQTQRVWLAAIAGC